MNYTTIAQANPEVSLLGIIIYNVTKYCSWLMMIENGKGLKAINANLLHPTRLDYGSN